VPVNEQGSITGENTRLMVSPFCMLLGADLYAVFGMDRVLKRFDRDFFQAP
jgi:hypothetical protein